MSRAYGWNAKLLIAEESTYGTLSDGTYTQVPFASSTIDSEQGLIASNVLGLGRDPTTPFQDVINVGGELAVPVDLRNIGIWLKAIFGTPTTTEDGGVYTHTFESGKVSLPSYTLEVGLPEVPEFIRFLGVKADSIAFNFARSGEAQATISLLAQGETAATTTVAASPEVKNYTRFSQFQGFIKSDGQALANVTAASLSDMAKRIKLAKDNGLKDNTLPDLDSPTKREAYADQQLILGLALAGIIEWDGVLEAESDEKAPLTPEKVEELFTNFWLVAENFRQQYCGIQEILAAEKNASTPEPSGTLVTGEVTAKDADKKKPSAPSTSADTLKQL